MRKFDDAAWLGKLPDAWGVIDLGQVYEERKVKRLTMNRYLLR